MEKGVINVLILSEQALVANGLKHFLLNKFGNNVRIQNYYDFRSFLKHIGPGTDVAVIDNLVEGHTGLQTLDCIKHINPVTEVIVHTSNDDVAAALNSFINGDQGILDLVKKFQYQHQHRYAS